MHYNAGINNTDCPLALRKVICHLQQVNQAVSLHDQASFKKNVTHYFLVLMIKELPDSAGWWIKENMWVVIKEFGQNLNYVLCI